MEIYEIWRKIYEIWRKIYEIWRKASINPHPKPPTFNYFKRGF
jgi:hypothetical protein